jgi:flavin-dependent dehydrogenase
MTNDQRPLIVVIGGGPAGSSVSRLLASWGYSVLLLNRTVRAGGTMRGLAESLPPSTRKLLAEVGVLGAVERAGFYPSTGNTVWWGSHDRRVEAFGADAEALGFQVHRPDFDRILLNEAVAAGVEVRSAHVRGVTLDEDEARVAYEHDGRAHEISCGFVIDCSGRAGVLARRFRQPGLRMYALVGEWHAADGWDLPDPTHTVVEAYDRGWAWSVPISPSVRHAGLMIDGPSPRGGDGRALADAYRAELAKTTALDGLLRGAALERAWACDATTYSSEVYGGPHFLLVGDAGSFIDPLSSFGVKKALASAWVAAIAVNTCLAHPDRQSCALEFFSDWERDVCASHARRARDFARDAAARHAQPFWLGRAAADLDEPEVAAPSMDHPNVRAALQLIRESPELDLALDGGVTFAPRPVIRGREIVLEDALTLPRDAAQSSMARALRFVDNVDLVGLAQLAGRHRQVPDLFDAYCRTIGPAPLPSVLGGLSLLVASGILRQRNVVGC